jgi:hypothetical protein
VVDVDIELGGHSPHFITTSGQFASETGHTDWAYSSG